MAWEKKSRTGPSPAREKKSRARALLAGLGHRGAVARPLDGGVLTRWGARTPARGPATAPGLVARSRSLGCAQLKRESVEREAEEAK